MTKACIIKKMLELGFTEEDLVILEEYAAVGTLHFTLLELGVDAEKLAKYTYGIGELKFMVKSFIRELVSSLEVEKRKNKKLVRILDEERQLFFDTLKGWKKS